MKVIRKINYLMLVCLLVFLSIVLISYSSKETFSNDVVINTPTNEDVKIYVSGDSVTKTENGYTAATGSTITVSAINEKSIFKSMTIAGTTYNTPVVELNNLSTTTLDISVESTAPTANDRGKYFANPYLVESGNSILALSRILDDNYANGNGNKEEDYAVFDLEPSEANRKALQSGYFRLTSNAIINSDDFFGIGERDYPFQGSFDFNGNYVYLSVNKTEFSKEEFVNVENVNRMDIGLFSIIYSDSHPCLIKNADVRGTIAVKTTDNPAIADINNISISIGGLVGTSGKNVIYDGVSSQVSISADVQKATLEIGGVFGFLSSNIDTWSNVVYKGNYGTITGITRGNKSNIYVGGLCGVLQNAYVRNFESNSQSTNFVATSYGVDGKYASGSAFSGGMAGVVYSNPSTRPEMQAVKPMVIEKIRLRVNSNFIVTSVIDNSYNKSSINSDNFTSTSAGAVAGGIVGTIYSNSQVITLSDLKVINDSTSDLEILAQTVDADSNGAVFAGGLVGYIFTQGAQNIKYKASVNADESQKSYIFATSTEIKALQNGMGPAYAGGIFGYNAFTFEADNPTYYFRLANETNTFDVTATQSLISRKGDKLYDVMAGFYSSKLQSGYSLKNFNLSLDSGSVTAKRESGSTAVGDVCAGGIAGYYDGNGSASFDNVTVDFTRSVSISALGYSYSSDYGQSKIGNNVCVGGLVGYIKNFTTGLVNNVNVDFNNNTENKAKTIAIEGVQNAVSGNADYATEGYVGGIFGMAEDIRGTNFEFNGNNEISSLIRFYSTNNPNTASVGGAIGATRKVNFNYSLSYVTVRNAHVVGRAFYDGNNSGNNFDLFVGGAVGVLGTASNISGTTASNIFVYDSVIESVGDENMLTYAGGIFGGIWYGETPEIREVFSIGNSVTASSVGWDAFAGGIAGFAQKCSIYNSGVITTSIYSSSNDRNFYVAGLVARVRNKVRLENNYSAASLDSKNKSNLYGLVGNLLEEESTWTTKGFQFHNNIFFSAISGTENMGFENSGRWDVYQSKTNNYAIYLDSNSKLSNELTLNVGQSTNVFSNINTIGSILSLKSNSSDLSINGLSISSSVPGEYYLYVTDNINGVDYNVCVSTIIVGGGTTGAGIELIATDQDNKSLDKYETYAVNGNVQYVEMHVGDDNGKRPNVLNLTAKNYSGYVQFYTCSITPTSSFEEILAMSKTSADISSFNGKVKIDISNDVDGTHVTIEPSVTLRDSALAIIVEIGDKQFIVKVLPNLVTDFNVIPSADTLPTAGDGSEGNPYVYSKNYTIRFETEVEYENPNMAYMVETKFTNAKQSSAIDVKTNGTVIIKDSATENTTYQIDCSLLSNTPNNMTGGTTKSVYIKVSHALNVVYNLSGATLSQERTDRVAVAGSQYKFAVSPTAGHGLDPTLTISNDAGFSWSGKVDRSGNTINANGINITYEVNESGEFIFTLPSEIVKNNTMNISLSFPLVYTILFVNERGETFDDKYFVVTIEAGKTLDQLNKEHYFDAALEWVDNQVKLLAQNGFVYGGLYLSENANSVADYGKSFEEMILEENGMNVNGTMAFYFRWQFGLTTKTPENVTIKSTMSQSSLDDTGIVPINDKKGFAFEIGIPNDWRGTPRFDFYIGGECITSLFNSESIANRYNIDPETLYNKMLELNNGNLEIVVYADSINLYQGDSAKKTSSNKMYEDGIFTLEYKINYGSTDTVSAGDLTFNFTENLPVGTNVAIYYSKDGLASWAGKYDIDTPTKTISLSSFVGMPSLSKTIDRTNVTKSEEFNLVITLPNNSNNFNILDNENGLNVEVRTTSYQFNPIVKEYKGNKGTIVLDDTIVYRDNITNVIFYDTIIRTLSNNNSQIVLSVVGSSKSDVLDLRHNSLYYFFEITRKDGSSVGGFTISGLTEAFRTDYALYFEATSQVVIPASILGEYKVRLISSTTYNTPGAGIILDTLE